MDEIRKIADEYNNHVSLCETCSNLNRPMCPAGAKLLLKFSDEVMKVRSDIEN